MGWLERLNQAEQRTGIKGPELARRCGIKYNTYRNYMTGQTQPSFDDFIKICAVFKVAPGYVLKDAPEGSGTEVAAYESFERLLSERGPNAVLALLEGSTKVGRDLGDVPLTSHPVREHKRPDPPNDPPLPEMVGTGKPGRPKHPGFVDLDQPAAVKHDPTAKPKKPR